LPLDDPGEVERDECCSAASSGTDWSICWRMCCVMWVSEKGRFSGGGDAIPLGLLYVSTVVRTAVAISSRDV
jgi:hypothetical protein